MAFIGIWNEYAEGNAVEPCSNVGSPSDEHPGWVNDRPWFLDNITARLAPVTQPTQLNVPSLTPTPIGSSTPGQPCQGDADRNGFVNALDYASVRDHYGQATCAQGDANGDCFVNAVDFRTVRDNYGQPCP
jgi:hypothetical protein